MVLEAASAALLRAAEAEGRSPIHESTPSEVRAASDPSVFGLGPAMHQVVDTTAHTAGGQHQVPVRLLVPSASPRATIVFFHGGGWVLGDVESYDTLGR